MMENKTKSRFAAVTQRGGARQGEGRDPVEQALTERHVERLAAVFRRYFQTQRDNLPVEAIRRLLRRGVEGTRIDTGAAAAQEDGRGIETILSDWLDGLAGQISPDLYSELEVIARRGFTDAVTEWCTLLSMGFVMRDHVAERFREWVHEEEERILREANERTRGDVAAIIAERIEEGHRLAQVLRAIRDYFDERRLSTVNAFAWFEAHNVLHGGEFMAKRYLGARVKRWKTSGLPDACEVCLENEAQRWLTMEQSFASGHLYPPAHPRCRCHVEYLGVTPESALKFLQHRGES